MDAVQQIEIPTPFEVGRVNCYLFTGAEATLLDPGPNTEAAYEALSAGLNEQGFSVSDVDHVLFTHPHMDHFGMANRIVEESGAKTVAHRDAVVALNGPDRHFERERAFFRPFLLSMGVPEDIIASALMLPEAYTEYRKPFAVDRKLADGDTIDVGGGLTAIHTPGHAPGSVCFVSRTDDVVFTGDHVLQDVTPNPLLTITPGAGDERTRSLPTYLESLNRLRRVDATVGRAGHGDDITDIDARIQETLEHHNDRKELIAGLINKIGPMSAYDVMQEMFPELPATEVFAGMSEVIGHLDLLEDENRVHIEKEDQVRQYSMI
ncbi:MBL fold metallo-hydrolase [Halomarina salina]|uniref:MBL fold metallo-hydrolase n=1 Tax=Halomarina salina TaxID=1872699 RepID=A0ABD5RTS5_9EURY|nr:MBL fold metallo-hydrolase [Halomarina salina]